MTTMTPTEATEELFLLVEDRLGAAMTVLHLLEERLCPGDDQAIESAAFQRTIEELRAMAEAAMAARGGRADLATIVAELRERLWARERWPVS